jgi:predicted nucleic acid-binding protein
VIAYLDSSVILRIVLREPDPLREWPAIDLGITSELTRVEAARVIDRLTVLGVLRGDEIAAKHAEIRDLFRRVDFLELDRAVLARASMPLRTVLGALDAIHLASALLYRETQRRGEATIVVATHDHALAAAARALDFEVIGA